jgi:hypothetical protein
VQSPAQQHRPLPTPAAGVSEWRAVPSSRGRSAGRNDDAASVATTVTRSVGFGAPNDVRVVEPSRLSPMRVDQVYAPVKYLSKANLQRHRSKAQKSQALPTMIRSSSVPRLDTMRSPDGREYYDPGHQRNGGAGGAQQQQQRGLHPDAHQEQQYHQQQQQQQQYEQQRYEQRQPQQRNGGRGMTRDEFMYRSQPGVDGGVASPPPRTPEDQYEHAAPRRAGSQSSAGSQSRTNYNTSRSPAAASLRKYIAREDANKVSLKDAAQMLAAARQLRGAFPSPQYGEEAFQLLYGGTYLVKYGRQGAPHERFLATRVMSDEQGRNVLYLLWALHGESATINDRLPLSCLVGVERGAGSENFTRCMVNDRQIRGPRTGSKPSILPTDFAFTLVFQTNVAMRVVTLLALDDQTYRCWLLVCEHLAAVNTAAGAVVPVDMMALSAESPRSASLASQR